ncbi:MAG TPA: hypothetical protein VN805_09570 [Caulobacteraceae bacterium]|nr:hypothetical protein [Caulobacteraceae bacterium]
MGFRGDNPYIHPMTDITPRFPLVRGPLQRPFDRVGIACLAWTGAFLCVTAVVAVLVR